VRREPASPLAGRRFGATYSDCALYRYRLWRAWCGGDRAILWIMLNPSTADHLGVNDPTIARCERRSVAWGFGRMEVVNLFALRSPDPLALRRSADPIGPDNDRHVAEAARSADVIVCAWGAQGALRRRAGAVRALVAGRALSCLGLTRSGEPAHPLYLPYDRQPVPYAHTGAPSLPARMEMVVNLPRHGL
jgi:hypothetical protein